MLGTKRKTMAKLAARVYNTNVDFGMQIISQYTIIKEQNAVLIN